MPHSTLGNAYILLCTFEYSNWVVGISIANEQAKTIADALFYKIITAYGTPKAVICDEAPAFYIRFNAMLLSCIKYFTILHFTNESWV